MKRFFALLLALVLMLSFAACKAPKTDPTTLCILAYVKGVEVTQEEPKEAEDGPLGVDTGKEGDGVTLDKDFAKFIDPANEQGYKASDLRYFGRIDLINGYGPNFSTETPYSFKGSSTPNGVAVFAYNIIK